jgi:diguanylate cyclase (GGDEF)-like protein
VAKKGHIGEIRGEDQMSKDAVLEIVRLCKETDTIAKNVYARLSAICPDPHLGPFWREMSEAEAEHVGFWRRLERIGERSGLPDLFDDPDTVIQELRHAAEKSKQLLAGCEKDYSTASAFVLAYRMEFYLLHPAFELLFHSLGNIVGGPNPETHYHAHINRFIIALTRYGQVTPELELLGETLQRLWRENRTLAHQATRDDLTGLLNRRGFFAAAIPLAFLAQRNNSVIGVLMIDLDNFKAVNDALGHKTGDSILTEISSLLSENLRASDVAGRYGGEEFIVLLPSASQDSASRTAEKIRYLVESTPPKGVPLTLSIGLAEGIIESSPTEELQELIRQADAALYRAKETGRNKVERYIGDNKK